MLQEQNLSRSPSGSTLLSPSMLCDNNNRKVYDDKSKKPSLNTQKKVSAIAAADKKKRDDNISVPSKVILRLPRKSITGGASITDPHETNQILPNIHQSTLPLTMDDASITIPKWLGIYF